MMDFIDNTEIKVQSVNTKVKNCDVDANKRKKKFTGGNASKRHRDRVNVEFSNLAKLLPFPESVIAKLDKSSILRLTVSFIQAKSFFKNAPRNVNTNQDDLPPQLKEGTGVVSEIFSQALDGFLLVLTEDMKVLFVSESVRDYLGYCQAGIIHENFLQFVSPADHGIVKSNMKYREEECQHDGKEKVESHDLYESASPSCSNDQFSARDLEMPIGSVSRGFVCRMKCAYSCSSRFYTAYRTFRFNGHLRKYAIRKGREQETFNTLVMFATPLTSTPAPASTENQSSSHTSTKSTDQTSYRKQVPERKELIAFERYPTGFRIEPTLRPHVAPIPVSHKEHIDAAFTPSKPPTLISSAEIPRLINHSNMGTGTKLTRAESLSTDSRCSDHSDDSKCSPASSPNLVWKQRSNSPGYISYDRLKDDYYNSVELDIKYRRKSVIERDYRWQKSPEYYKIERYDRPSSRNSNVDIYTDSKAYVKMYRDRRSPISPNYTEYLSDVRRKRYYDYYHNHDDEPYFKRAKNISPEPKKTNFNISSLLDLDDKKESKAMYNERSAFTELIKRSYISNASRYDHYRKERYIPVRTVYEKIDV